MIVKVLNVDSKESGSYVEFSTKVGIGYGEWFGVVEKGREYGVELDIPTKLTWGKDLIEINESLELINRDGSFHYLQGTIEDLYEDGVIALRIDSSIILLETTGHTIAKKGSWVQIKTSEIRLYNIDI